MAHFAELDEANTVVRVIVLANKDMVDSYGQESESIGAEFCHKLLGGRWVQTSYNNSFRKRFACVGSTYDPERDAFINPKPFSSWVFDEATLDWVPPEPKPNDGRRYVWDEGSLSWKDITEELRPSSDL